VGGGGGVGEGSAESTQSDPGTDVQRRNVSKKEQHRNASGEEG